MSKSFSTKYPNVLDCIIIQELGEGGKREVVCRGEHTGRPVVVKGGGWGEPRRSLALTHVNLCH